MFIVSSSRCRVGLQSVIVAFPGHRSFSLTFWQGEANCLGCTMFPVIKPRDKLSWLL